jgi:hypothetical protein
MAFGGIGVRGVWKSMLEAIEIFRDLSVFICLCYVMFYIDLVACVFYVVESGSNLFF